MDKRILIILTSNAKMGDSPRPTGIWADELAVPYLAFTQAGASVHLASPKGGPVPFDPASIGPQGKNSPQVEAFLADAAARQQVEATLPVSDIDPAAYDAVFFPGGHGTMWDLPEDKDVKRIVEAAFAAGKVIAAVCHGPSGLVSARRPDGQSILAGKRVNSFTDQEEAAAGLSTVVPFALETRIRDLGGQFEKAPNWQPFAVRDGKLITGQNPASSGLVAQHLLNALQTPE